MSVNMANIRMLKALRTALVQTAEDAKNAARAEQNSEIAVVQLTNAHLLLDLAGACRLAAVELAEQEERSFDV